MKTDWKTKVLLIIVPPRSEPEQECYKHLGRVMECCLGSDVLSKEQALQGALLPVPPARAQGVELLQRLPPLLLLS